MIALWLMFIAVGLITYTAFLKLAARFLRYSASWKISFLFAGIMLSAVIVDHVLVVSEPMAVRIGHAVVLVLGLVILVAGSSAGAARTARARCSVGPTVYD